MSTAGNPPGNNDKDNNKRPLPPFYWVDAAELKQLLNIDDSTLKNWCSKVILNPSTPGGKGGKRYFFLGHIHRTFLEHLKVKIKKRGRKKK